MTRNGSKSYSLAAFREAPDPAGAVAWAGMNVEAGWKPDILGEEFESLDLHLGADPEGEGEAVATLVRRGSGDRAVLWVHGMTDYFFQTHVAEWFNEQGYAFYALDLRKCGRARQRGQRWHYSENFEHYFPDLTAALKVITSEVTGGVVPLAHSTGGLIVPLWLDHLRRHEPALMEEIPGLILNSPWLDMQYPTWAVRALKPVVNVLGKRFPTVKIPGGNLRTYAESIHVSEHGEWKFDTTLKPLEGHDKYLGWLRTVLISQKRIQTGGINVAVPVLTLLSSSSYLGKAYSAAADTADVVLDVEQIERWAPKVGPTVTLASIDGARHDVFLSLPHALKHVKSTTREWLAAL